MKMKTIQEAIPASVFATLQSSMKRYGIPDDDAAFINALFGAHNKKYGYMLAKEAEMACKAWVETGHDSTRTFIAAHILTDMKISNIVADETIYNDYIIRYITSKNMFPSVNGRGDGLSSSIRKALYGDEPVPFRHIVYRHESLYSTYSFMRRMFNSEGGKIMDAIGFDMVYDIIHTVSGTLFTKIYKMTRKKAISIVYELRDDAKSREWFMSLLDHLQGSRITLDHKITTQWIRDNSVYPLEFILEIPSFNHVDLDVYAEAGGALLYRISGLQSTGGCIDPSPSTATTFGLYRSMAEMLGLNVVSVVSYNNVEYHQEYREYTQYIIDNLYKIISSLMALPDMVWRTMYQSYPVIIDDDDESSNRHPHIPHLIELYAKGCTELYSGFKLNRVSSISSDVKNARKIIGSGNDAIYRWAVWTNMNALLQDNRDEHYLIGRAGMNAMAPEVWEYVDKGTMPDALTYTNATLDAGDAIFNIIHEVLSNTPKDIESMEHALASSSFDYPLDYIFHMMEKILFEHTDTSIIPYMI